MLPTVRSISIEEVRKVIEFTKQFENESEFLSVDVDYCTNAYRDMIEKGIATILVLEKEDKLIGSFAFITAPDITNGKKTAIEMFWFVSPESRGRGLLLFKEFEKIAKEKRVEQIAMIHMADCQPEKLKRFYERSGYRLLESHYIKELAK